MKDGVPTLGQADSDLHFFDTEHGSHVLVVDGSRIFDVPADLKNQARFWTSEDLLAFQRDLGLGGYIDDEPPRDVPVRSLSLAVAQKCNLGCTYCYASGGDFGGPARSMDWNVAKASVDQLMSQASQGDRVNLAFLGGEPLINRRLIYRATEYATSKATKHGVTVGFSITTNGTLLNASDATFFEEHGFAVTISLDGVGKTHDALRPYKGGRGSFDAILNRIKPLLEQQNQMQVGARVTVTPHNLNLPETLSDFVELGFHSVGFSPMIASPNGQGQLSRQDLMIMLEQMKACGDLFTQQTIAGKRFPFSNMAAAMHEIHRGTHRPYPCGAGAGYFGVSADGALYACHRFVDDAPARLGDVATGPDRFRQDTWLEDRHVHAQSPCKTCWARYQCGGGCHHEVIQRGRPACDYIRGWLHYCLQSYVRLLEARPDFFGPLAVADDSRV